MSAYSKLGNEPFNALPLLVLLRTKWVFVFHAFFPSFLLSDARDYGAVLGQGSLPASFFQGARSEHRPVQGK